MLIKQEFEVAQPLDAVWAFFQDVPSIANCLPGANLTEDLGDDRYGGNVLIRMGPVKLSFSGTAEISERDEVNRRIVVDGSGADEKGRGNAVMKVTATLTPIGSSTRVNIVMDLVLSGAAAQYGRGMVADVTAILVGDFVTNMSNRLSALEKGLDPNSVAVVKPASGLTIGLRAARLALARVFSRFFLPYAPSAN